MEKKYANSGKVKGFLKRNIYYFVIGFCVLAIAAMITVAVVTTNRADQNPDPNPNIIDPGTDDPIVKPDPKPDDPIVKPDPKPDDPIIDDPTTPGTVDPIAFCLPVAAGDVVREYSMTAPVAWQNGKKFAVHNGIDFASEAGTQVLAAYDGTVIAAEYDFLNGMVVKIDHGDGLVTSYGSLGEELSVSVGDSVKKGDVIGVMSESGTKELDLGAHMHFSVYEDGKVVSPYDYLSLGEK